LHMPIVFASTFFSASETSHMIILVSEFQNLTHLPRPLEVL